jgi:hypothetical protein
MLVDSAIAAIEHVVAEGNIDAGAAIDRGAAPARIGIGGAHDIYTPTVHRSSPQRGKQQIPVGSKRVRMRLLHAGTVHHASPPVRAGGHDPIAPAHDEQMPEEADPAEETAQDAADDGSIEYGICSPRSVDLPGACTFHVVQLVDRRNADERVVRWVMGCELERILYNNDAST